MTPGAAPAPRGHITILDKPELARLLRDRIADTRELKAAKQARISQPVLNKILNQKKERLAPKTFRFLVRYLGRGRGDRLRKAVLTRESANALDEYRSWLSDELRDISQHPQPHADDPFTDLSTWMKGESFTRDGERQGQVLVDLLYELTDHPDHPTRRELFEEFVGWARRRGWEGGVWGARGKLALLRIVGPLLASTASGGIERSVRDMDERELTEYLKVAIRKEQILMSRTPDLERAQELAHPQPPQKKRKLR